MLLPVLLSIAHAGELEVSLSADGLIRSDVTLSFTDLAACSRSSVRVETDDNGTWDVWAIAIPSGPDDIEVIVSWAYHDPSGGFGDRPHLQLQSGVVGTDTMEDARWGTVTLNVVAEGFDASCPRPWRR